MEHVKNSKIAHPWVVRGTASAPFLPAQGVRAQGNSLSPHPRPLPTVVLARAPGQLPEHHASASAKSRNSVWRWELTATQLELASNPALTGGVSATPAPCLCAHTAGGHSHEDRKDTVAYGVHPKYPT